MGVVKVRVALHERCVIDAGLVPVLIFFGQTRAPVKSTWDLGATGILLNLFFKQMFSVVILAAAERKPRRLPVRIRGIASSGKELVLIGIVLDGVIVVLAQQVHVAGGEQGLLQPRTGGMPLLQVLD